MRAAESGCLQAQYNAGASLATGEGGDAGVREQPEAALAWYRRAAEAGYAEAQYNLAFMLFQGEGCEPDLAAAKRWLKSAIAGGYDYAKGLLADLEVLK